MRSGAAGGLFANLKGRSEVLRGTGWDQKGCFVPYSERVWKSPSGRDMVLKWGTQFSTLSLTRLWAIIACSVLTAAEVWGDWGFVTVFITFDAGVYITHWPAHVFQLALYLIHGGYGLATALGLCAVCQLRPHWLILLAFEVPFSGVGTSLGGSWHMQSVLNPCPVFLGWPQGFLWMGNNMERTKQKPKSCNVVNRDP